MSRAQHSPIRPLSDAQKATIQTTLERVLASQAFRKSEQCQRFLKYVVEHSIEGRDEVLKERNIGVEVFGRPPDYDTADDPIVRVRATEVRKRLAQYHGECASGDEVVLEIPSGSYRVEAHWTAPVAVAAAPVAKRRAWPWPVGIGVALVLCASTILFLWQRPVVPSIVDQFWSPAYGNSKPVLLYCGQPVVYFLSQRVRQEYRSKLPAEKQRGVNTVTLGPEVEIKGSDIIPVTEQFVGIGNAHTAAALAVMFAGKRKAVDIRYANDVSFSDLRGGAAVLLGAFSNLWTLELQEQSRFVFEQEPARRIRDQMDNRTWQLSELASDGKTPEDYAIVTRLHHRGTGQFLVSAAGITQYGTRAAGEFLTSTALLGEAAKKWPADWSSRNLQVLLHTTIYHGTPGPPTVVAMHVW